MCYDLPQKEIETRCGLYVLGHSPWAQEKPKPIPNCEDVKAGENTLCKTWDQRKADALQKELDALKKQLADANKLMQEFAKEGQACSISFAQFRACGPGGCSNLGDQKK